MTHRARCLLALAACTLLTAVAPAPADAQRRRRGGGEGAEVAESSTPRDVRYDGRFTFARIRYSGGLDFAQGFSRDLPWSHDFPRAERHFTRILGELSTARVRAEQSVVLSLNDPALGRYPVAYMAEPGYWRPTDEEAEALRRYLAKGGFLIFDDFAGRHWMNFEQQIRRVLPWARLQRMSLDHPVFDAFYRIRTLDYAHPYYGVPSEFWGIFENNDPDGRLMVVVNYNNDLAEYWEFSDTGFFPIALSNDAYKLGVNYILYALSR